MDLIELARNAEPWRHLVVNMSRQSYDVRIDRATKWGNPFSHLPGTKSKFRVNSRELAIFRYEEYLLSRPDLVAAAKLELRGKRLGCHCAPRLCHGHILARVANE